MRWRSVEPARFASACDALARADRRLEAGETGPDLWNIKRFALNLVEGHEKAHSPPLEDWQTVEGQDGFDTLQFNGAAIAEQITISANGERVLFTRDMANVVMDTNGVRDGVVKTAVTGVFVTVLIVVLVLDGGTLISAVARGAVGSAIRKAPCLRRWRATQSRLKTTPCTSVLPSGSNPASRVFPVRFSKLPLKHLPSLLAGELFSKLDDLRHFEASHPLS